jgi:hypothetical protein
MLEASVIQKPRIFRAPILEISTAVESFDAAVTAERLGSFRERFGLRSAIDAKGGTKGALSPYFKATRRAINALAQWSSLERSTEGFKPLSFAEIFHPGIAHDGGYGRLGRRVAGYDARAQQRRPLTSPSASDNP